MTNPAKKPAKIVAPAKQRTSTKVNLPGRPSLKILPAPTSPRDGQNVRDTQTVAAVPGSFLRSPFLRLSADVVDDLENVRNANQNRLRQLTRAEADSDGKHRGFGLPTDHPDVRRLEALVEALDDSLDMAIKNLERVMRSHPLWTWAQPITGVGAKQFARLLGALGDPYWHDGDDRPRGLYELYSYCGLAPVDGAGRRRTRGELANWNDEAKMRVYLIAERCMIAVAQPERNRKGSPYRVVYDQARAKYEDAVHTHPCPPCGTPGKPAPVGSDLRDGHKNRRALRIVAKTFLKDLWKEAERLHKEAAAGEHDAATESVAKKVSKRIAATRTARTKEN
jgi:hypothetical protein